MSILDHIITNNENLYSCIEIQDSPYSDHRSLISTWKITAPKKSDYRKVVKHKIDYKEIEKQFTECSKSSITTFQQLITLISAIIFSNTKTYELKVKENNEWINKEIIELIKKRNNIYSRYRRNPDNQNLKAIYYEFKNKIARLVKERKKSYFNNKIENAGDNSAKIWFEINQVLNKKLSNVQNTIETILTTDNELLSEKQQIADKMNEYFANVGKELSRNVINMNRGKYEYTTEHGDIKASLYKDMAKIEKVTEKEISEIILQFKNNVAPGKDGISTKIIKLIAKDIVPIITQLINDVISTGVFPDILKQTVICPIHKGGDKLSIGNYRPISLLSVFTKIIEKVLYNKILSHIMDEEIISKNQYAYMKNSGTASAATDLTHEILQSLDDGNYTITIFIDLQKAFDTVDKTLLSKKIERYGIKGATLKLIDTYLENRMVQTKIGDVLSRSELIPLGIPQGGVLAPLLFILYTNDISKCPLHGSLYIYADDMCLMHKGKEINKMEEQIYHDLNILNEWFLNNKMLINVKKTKYMVIMPKNKSDINIELKIDDQQLERVQQYKYLGLTITSKMNWDSHINNICKLNAATIASIYKIRNLLNDQQKKMIYSALFLSKNIYLFNIWGNTTKTNFNRIQRQQNKILKVLYNIPRRTPTVKLYEITKELNMTKRKILTNCMFIHKIKNNLIKTNITLHENKVHNPYNTRRKSEIKQLNARTNAMSNGFIRQGIKQYNKIPKSIKINNTINFKQKCKEYLQDLHPDDGIMKQ